MKPSRPGISRRDFFASLIPGRRTAEEREHATLRPPPKAPPPPAADVETVAVIAGRFCLAYQGTFCSTCHERCPVPGAMIVERGLPRVDPAICTGCRVCHDVCPAPTNAVRLIPRPHSAGPNPPPGSPDTMPSC